MSGARVVTSAAFVMTRAKGKLLRTAHKKRAAVSARDVALHPNRTRKCRNDEPPKARAELEKVRSRRADLYEFAPVAYVSVDGDGRVLEANHTAAVLFGAPKTKLVGSPFCSLFHSRDAEVLARHLRAAFRGTRRQIAEVALRSDARRYVQLTSVRARTPEGGLECRVVLVDITERHHAELEATQSTRRLTERIAARTVEAKATAAELAHWLTIRDRELAFTDRLIDLAPVAILVLDAEGRIVQYNRYLERLSGYPLAETKGLDAFDVFAPADERDARRAEHLRMIANPLPTTNTARVLTRDGKERRVEWHTLVVTQEDTPLGLWVGEDVTEKQELEAALRHAQKMEAVGTLASGIAHDFNNLLMGIIGCADVALSKLAVGSPAAKLLDEIKGSAGASAAIVNQLMTFAHKSDIEPGPFDLGKLVQERRAMLQHLSRDDIDVIVDAAPGNWVMGDPGQIEQVILNLAVNAFHAMPEGGTLRVEVLARGERCAPGLGAKPCCALLSVSDTGVGMDEKTRERIFEPFFTTKRAGQGTGLGLSTVYAIVDRHGGTIEVESTPGKGTSFTVCLPTVAAPEVSEATGVVEPPRSRRETILLVEDEPLVRLSVRHYLERRGYHVLEAATGAAARRVAEGHGETIQLLLTDVDLPKTSGPRLAKALRETRPELLVVYMSAHSREHLESGKRMESGAVLLRKPFSESALLQKVGSVLMRSNATRSPGARPTLLVVDDDTTTRMALTELLAERGFDALAAASARQALALISERQNGVDLLVTDLGLPDMDGAALVLRVRERWPALPVVFVSGQTRHDPAVATATRLTRATFLEKPVDADTIAAEARALLAPLELGSPK